MSLHWNLKVNGVTNSEVSLPVVVRVVILVPSNLLAIHVKGLSSAILSDKFECVPSAIIILGLKSLWLPACTLPDSDVWDSSMKTNFSVMSLVVHFKHSNSRLSGFELELDHEISIWESGHFASVPLGPSVVKVINFIISIVNGH